MAPASAAFEERVRRAHNHLYANANVRTPDAIGEEVLKVILALMHAEREPLRAHRPLSKTDLIAINRADAATCGRVAEEVQEQFSSVNGALRRYPEGSRIELDSPSIAFVRATLDGTPFWASDRDWLGDAVEVFRSLTAKRLGGQFFTDQNVTELAMTLLEFNPPAGDDLLDICAGTGGFLLAGTRRVIAALGTEISPERLADSAARTIRGLEVDANLARVANNTLHSITGAAHDFVLQADSLSPDSWSSQATHRVTEETHLCLASNPPFGTKITIKDTRLLARYDLAHNWRKTSGVWQLTDRRVTPRPPDVLFIERNLQLAQPGRGRVLLVTPYQVLSGPQLGFVREWILRHARVSAVVDLPADTFQPWTGTKASLLVLERREEPLPVWSPQEEYPVFMAVADFIGHDRRGQPVLDDDGNVKTDLPSVGLAFRAFRRGSSPKDFHASAFLVNSGDFTQQNDLRLNAAFHRPARKALKRSVIELAIGTRWTVRTIGDVTKAIFYPGRFKRNYVEAGGVPFLSGTNISQLVPTNRKFLRSDSPRVDEMRVQAGWILVTRSGSTGIVSSVPPAWDGIAISEHVIRVVPDPSQLDPGYLEAYLRSSFGQDLISAGVFGSVIDEITPEHIASIPIPIPNGGDEIKKCGEEMRRAQTARDEAMRGIEASVVQLEQTIRKDLQLRYRGV